jgi:HAE1 family hydrophobic/amphiphilic exporter-1
MVASFVNSPVKVAVGVILVALFGGIALYRMPMQLTPDVEVPTITIETRWPGASPQEIEKEIVQEQEEQLQSVEGLQKLSSESMDSMGRIILEFAVDADMNKALLMVNTRLQQVPSYPEDADEPVVSTSNLSERFIAWFILNVKPPPREHFDEYAGKFPQLAGEIHRIRDTDNSSLRLLRLREAAQKHPELMPLVVGGKPPVAEQLEQYAVKFPPLADELRKIRDIQDPMLRGLRFREAAQTHPELTPFVPAEIDLTTLRRFCEDNIETRFERVNGVSNCNVVGGREEEMQVVVEPDLLAKSGLTYEAVRVALRNQNIDVSAGDLWEGKRRIVVRTLGEFRAPEQIEAAILTRVDGRPIYVRDVAKVRLGYKKPDGVVRRYGKPVMAMNIQRESGANVLDIMDGARVAMDQLNKNLLEREGLELTQVYDETEYINSSMDLVTENVAEGAVLSFIVLLLFLKNVRSSLVIFTAIATSMIGMFLVMGLLGRSLNLLSLAGISFAVGMLVDNFIVVLENIFRHRQQGDSIVTAVVNGTGEVWGAIIASTVANLAVFVPVLFVPDQVGQLFHDLALAVSAALGLSLLVSLIVVPTAAGYLLSHGDGGIGDEAARKSRLHGLFAPFDYVGSKFTDGVVSANRALQQTVFGRLMTIAGCLAFSISLTWVLMPKVEYLPNGNRNLAIGLMVPPPGYNLDQLNAIGETIETKMRKYWDTEADSLVVKRMLPEADSEGKPVMVERELEVPTISDFFYVARGRMLFMGMRARDQLRAAELVGQVREATADIPGMITIAKQSSLFENGLGAGRTVDIEITGPDVPTLVALARRTMGQVAKTMPKAQFIPKPSADLSAAELHIKPRWDQAADLGMTAAELGFAINALIDGAYAADYNFEGDQIDLSIVGNENMAKTAQDVRGLSLFTPQGRAVTLESVADIELSSGPEQINRRERQRAITVVVTPPPEMAVEDALNQIRENIVVPIETDPKYSGFYTVNLSGTADKLQSTWLSIRWNLLLAVIITYLVIAALFESWLYPLIIMLSVPLGAVGGFVGLKLLNLFVLQPLDMFTMVGFIILVGTVVNNPILIIEQALVHIREDGMHPRDAIVESVRTRIRPIFMTALIGLLGLLPLVISPGAGSELYRGLGSVTLGGLVFSTFFTLFFIPALFTICTDLQESLRATFRRPRWAAEHGATRSAASPVPIPVELEPAPPHPGSVYGGSSVPNSLNGGHAVNNGDYSGNGEHGANGEHAGNGEQGSPTKSTGTTPPAPSAGSGSGS